MALLVVIAAACSSGTSKPIPIAAPSSVPTTRTTEATAPTSAPSPNSLAPGARINPDLLEAMSFVDRLHGFALVRPNVGSRVELAASTNGGATWEAIGPGPLKDGYLIQFTSRFDGWAYGPDRLVTHDGGSTWTSTHPGGGQVDDLSAIGSSIWSLVRCNNLSNTCADHLESSSDGGRTWHTTNIPGLPAFASALDRLDDTHAFVWSAFGPGADQRALLATDDGGQRWQPTANPCGPTLAGFSAVNASDLWTSCSYSGETAAPKELFRSRDGGTTWTLAARWGFVGLADVGQPPHGGYGGSLIALSDQVAILSAARGTVSVSTDGGHTWSDAIQGGDFFGTVTRLARTNTIWVATTDIPVGGVLQATDGIHFHIIAGGVPRLV